MCALGSELSTRYHTRLPRQSTCYRFVGYSSLEQHSNGRASSTSFSKIPIKSVIIGEIEEGVASSTNPNQFAWLPTGQRVASDTGSFKSNANVYLPSPRSFCCRTGWKITLVGSHFTHTAESRYAPVEGVALAGADALDKVRFFVLGCSDLIIAVDHKPLLKIYGDRSLEENSNGRLRNLKEKTLRYKFRIVHIPGVRHKAADAVSRYLTNPDLLILPDDVAATSDSVIPLPLHPSGRSFLAGICCNEPSQASCSSPIDDRLASSVVNTMAITWDRVKLATTSDQEMLYN